MSEIKKVLDGYNAGYIIQQKRPEVFKQLESAVGDTELPFFDSFVKGGIESKEERLKLLMLDKNPKKTNIKPPSISDPSKDEIDLDIE